MAQSYKTGTVTVTAGSTSVIGNGTAWLLALVTGGLFCCAGMAVPCTVIDDTHLELDYPWPGTTGSGKAYSIFRETAQAASAVVANDRLAELVNRIRLSPYADATIIADQLLYGSGPGQLSATPLTAFARSLLAAANGSAARTTLELVKQTSTTDATAGRLMGVGAFGLGSTSILLSETDNLNSLPDVTAFYNWGNPTPANAPDSFCEMLQISRNSATAIQIAFNSASRSFIRGKASSTWEAWRPFGSSRAVTSNGSATRFQDGTQICVLSGVTIPFTNVDQLGYNWLFPAAFAAPPEFIGLTSVNTGASYVGIQRASLGHAYASYNATQSQLGWVRSYGAPNFVAGNEVQNQRLVAIGRYI